MRRNWLIGTCQQVIQGEAQSPPDPSDASAPVRRNDEPQRADPVGREFRQSSPLAQRPAHEPEMELFKIAEAAVYQLR